MIYILKRYILLFDDVPYSLYRTCTYDTLYQNDILCCLMITVHDNVHPIINMIYPDDTMVPNS